MEKKGTKYIKFYLGNFVAYKNIEFLGTAYNICEL